MIRRQYQGTGGFSPKVGNAPVTNKYGSIIHADSFGTNIALRSKAPPPVAEYDAHIASAYRNRRCINASGAQLRRIVIMRRNGSTWKECGEAVGVTGSAARDWVVMLPLALAV